jgi:uncharacterized protein YbjQ (UPF0145 family)
MQNSGLGQSLTHLGAVRVRLTGIVKGDVDDVQPASIAAPTVAEARAALDRVAQVSGAEKVVQVGSDYRRIALASGPLSTQTMVEVQAWGTAVRAEAEAAPRDESESDPAA